MLQQAILEHYNNAENYQVIDCSNKNNVAVIYFSSNGVFTPDTVEEFKEVIINHDRYEWKRNQMLDAKRHIFVRDILKNWYLRGINGKVNTVEKLVELLKELTDGYKVITVGSSAGGFASVLFGILLKAKYVFCFSGQISLYEVLGRASHKSFPLLFEDIKNDETSRYYNLLELINKSDVPIFYFGPIKNISDRYNSEILLKSHNTYVFRFNIPKHGIPFYSFNLEPVLNMSCDNLIKISNSLKNKIISRLWFSILVSGYTKTFSLIAKQICKSVVKKNI